MASNLTTQVRNIAAVTTAVANGDLSKKITVDVKGEILELKNTVNTMVDQLNSFASEVTRVAREVGTEGRLGGQADVKGVGGTWKDLTDYVNFMAGNLTDQVRGIAKVVTAVANGDLKQKLLVEAKGEIAALADTINCMTDTLAMFADQVDHGGARSGRGRKTRRPGERARRGRHLARSDRQRESARRQSDHSAARDCGRRDGGDERRSDPIDSSRRAGRSRRSSKDNINEMIRNLKRHDVAQQRAGLAEDEPGEVHPHAAGPERSAHGRPA